MPELAESFSTNLREPTKPLYHRFQTVKTVLPQVDSRLYVSRRRHYIINHVYQYSVLCKLYPEWYYSVLGKCYNQSLLQYKTIIIFVPFDVYQVLQSFCNIPAKSLRSFMGNKKKNLPLTLDSGWEFTFT